MTDAQRQAVLSAATQVASYPPEGAGKNTYACLVPWTRMQALRDALDNAGIEWTWNR